MKKNIQLAKITCLILIVVFILTSCKNTSKQVDLLQTSPDISVKEITQPTVAETITTELITTEPEQKKYTYQLPECCQNIEWEYDQAICHIEFIKVNAEDITDDIIPSEIVKMCKEELFNSYTEEDKEFFGVYFGGIEYYKFDFNDDGIKDYMIKAIPGADDLVGWKFYCYTTDGIFLSQNDGTYKYIKCDLDAKYISIMKHKTNGLYDILGGYFGNEICKFNGNDSYTSSIERAEGGSSYNIENNIYCLDLMFGTIPKYVKDDKQYYIVMKVEKDKSLEHSILYASKSDGTPLIYPTEVRGNITFYCKLKDSYNSTGYNWFKQLKFVPVPEE